VYEEFQLPIESCKQYGDTPF